MDFVVEVIFVHILHRISHNVLVYLTVLCWGLGRQPGITLTVLAGRLESHHLHKSQTLLNMPRTPALEGGDRQLPGAPWPAWPAVMSVECCEKVGPRQRQEDVDVLHRATCTPAQTHNVRSLLTDCPASLFSFYMSNLC